MKCSRCRDFLPDKNIGVTLYDKSYYVCGECGELLEDMLQKAEQVTIEMFAEPMLRREKKFIH